MTVTLLYFDGCLDWRTTDELLTGLADELGFTLTRRRVETPQQAGAEGFRGSPTVLVDGAAPSPAATSHEPVVPGVPDARRDGRRADRRAAPQGPALRRVLAALAAAYLAAAVVTRVSDAAGRRACGCADACWCRRPGLRLFRWVLPYGHQARLLG